MRSKLFKREQVKDSPAFNAPLAQPHDVLSHQRHQRVVRFRKTKGPARVREGCGHDSDLIGSKVRPARKGAIGMPHPTAFSPPTHLHSVEKGELVSDAGG